MNVEKIDIVAYKNSIEKIRMYTSSLDILLVEDYEPLHETLKRFLLSLFKNVDGAFDGQSALAVYKKKVAKQENYALVFTDIEMPNMNGIELVKEIKKINFHQEIVVFSAHQESKYLLELINQGIRRFISKPINLSLLLEDLLQICQEVTSCGAMENRTILSKDIYYNKEEKFLYFKDEPIILTKYESCVLELLIKKINLSVSNEDIIDYLYLQMIDLQLENVRKLMYKLRKKLPKELIQSVHGVGYRIVLDKATT